MWFANEHNGHLPPPYVKTSAGKAEGGKEKMPPTVHYLSLSERLPLVD